MKWFYAAVLAGLLLVRLPSLVQPMGGDQGIYATVGQSILNGGVPYRDAWDQKPPALHFTYAAMFAVWNSESVVPAADLVVAAVVTVLLILLGGRLAQNAHAGYLAAAGFLLLGDPSFQRLAGLWNRGQAETFISLLVTAAVLCAHVSSRAALEDWRRQVRWGIGGGMLLGLAFLFKYNAGAYLAVVLLVGLLVGVPTPSSGVSRAEVWSRRRRFALSVLAGFVIPVVVTVVYFAIHGALGDLIDATLIYNLQYSGETYDGTTSFVRYLLTFPIQRARVDALWFVGGLGCLALLVHGLRGRREAWIAPVWVAAACLSIAVNSGRNLPQYFVQAAPALALAFGVAAAISLRFSRRLVTVGVVVLVLVAVVRINQFDKLWSNVMGDWNHARGLTPRREYLARFGGQRPTDKFSALASAELGDWIRHTTARTDRIFVLGFSAPVYVRAERLTASRFFWSRPLLVGFNEGRPEYGASGLLQELTRHRPAVVVLQKRDWPTERTDSITWFMQQPALVRWLEQGYRKAFESPMYSAWRVVEPGRAADGTDE